MTDPANHNSSVSASYDSRSAKYDDSWHGELARFLASSKGYAPPPGSSVLDLCTGTFLLGAEYASVIGPSGKVLGVDISRGMLEIGRRRIEQLKISDHCSVVYRNVLDLDTPLTEAEGAHDASEVNVTIARDSWDVISCCSAFVLLPKFPPSEILRYWKQYLRPGTGRMVIDFTAVNSQFTSVAFSQIARRHGFRSPLDREWISGPEAVQKQFEDAGLKVEQMETAGPYTAVDYVGSKEEVDRLFARCWENPLLRACCPEGMSQEEAKREFAEIWQALFEKFQQGGIMKDEFRMYVFVASRPQD